MYSMVWCLATALAWLTLRLVRDGGRPSRAAAWIIVVVAGSVHPLLLRLRRARVRLPGCCCGPGASRDWRRSGWERSPRSPWPHGTGRCRRRSRAGGLPVPGSTIRFTGPSRPPVRSSSRGACSRVAVSGVARRTVDAVLAALYALLALWLLRGGQVRSLFAPDRRLVWLWVAAVVLGPWVFDLLRNTGASRIPRYVLSGLPAAMLLVALRRPAAVRPVPFRVRRTGAARLDRGTRSHRPTAEPPGRGLRCARVGPGATNASRWGGPGALGPVGRDRIEPRAHAGPAVPRLDRAARAPACRMSFRLCSRVVLRSHWSRSTTSAWLHPPSAGSASTAD